MSRDRNGCSQVEGSLLASKGTFSNQKGQSLCTSVSWLYSYTGKIPDSILRLHSLQSTTSFRLASAALSVIFDGKGLRVAEYMFMDAILDKLFKRNAYVKYFLAKAKKRIEMRYCTRMSTRMYKGSVTQSIDSGKPKSGAYRTDDCVYRIFTENVI